MGGAGVLGGEDGAGAEGSVRAERGPGAFDDGEGVRGGEGDLDEFDALLGQGQHGAQGGVGVTAPHYRDQAVGGERGGQVHGRCSFCAGVEGQRQAPVSVRRQRTSPDAGTRAASSGPASARSKTRPSMGSTPVLRYGCGWG